MLPAYIFLDLDGTLIDSFKGIFKCMNYTLLRFGRKEAGEELIKSLIGKSLENTFQVLLNESDTEQIRNAVETYRDRYSLEGYFEFTVYDEVTDSLSAISREVEGVFLVSTKARVFCEKILDILAFTSIFKGIYGAELSDRGFRKEVELGRRLEELRLDPSECMMVGDRAEDMIAGKINRATAVGVTWGYGSRKELEDSGADFLVDSAAELTTLVNSLRRKQ